jgi:uncharacterized repeat protein (TIGR03803 family)
MKKTNTHLFISRVLSVVAVGVALATAAWAQTETILHSFSDTGGDGGYPEAGLTIDNQGNLYGTTRVGGAAGGGTIFELVPGSSGTWTENVLFSFSSVKPLSDLGFTPASPLAIDSAGNLYGTTTYGGGSTLCGTAFELSRGAGSVTYQVLYSFYGGTEECQPADTGFVLDSAGNLYGVCYSCGAYGFGAVYELVRATGWTEKFLYSFKGLSGGAYPHGTLVFDNSGNLYGLAFSGGAHDYGVVFELSPGSGGTWTEKVIDSFPAGGGGAYPSGNLVLDSAGNLYGGAAYMVFELIHGSSGTWTAKTLHSFTGGSDGANLVAGLIFDKAGNLYGTTEAGGTHRGTVFELTPGSSGTWTEKILHRFSASGGDAIFPASSLTMDANGHLYGMTHNGGSSNHGAVFEVTP